MKPYCDSTMLWIAEEPPKGVSMASDISERFVLDAFPRRMLVPIK
jgi:hypothetical protein